ncbi:MAG: hypothetical protein HOL58_00600 [Francisellaceae bacterium]|nr:hypothetical protein [Francisellaceae bacterium]
MTKPSIEELELGYYKVPTKPQISDLVLKYKDCTDLYWGDVQRAIKNSKVTLYNIVNLDEQQEEISRQLKDKNKQSLNRHIGLILNQNDSKLYAIHLDWNGDMKTTPLNERPQLQEVLESIRTDSPKELSLKDSTPTLNLVLNEPDDFDPAIVGVQEQLTPKGIALLSHIQAQKKQQANQPLVATNMDDIIHVADAINKARVGDKVSIIYHQLHADADFHKIVIMLQKTATGIQAYYLDSGNQESGYIFHRANELNERLLSQAIQVEHVVPVDYASSAKRRQYDSYQCGTFAIKDARSLASDRFDKSITGDLPPMAGRYYPKNTKSYALPPASLKSQQSSKSRNFYLSKMRNHAVKVSNDGETLGEFYERYKDPLEYARKFSRKNRDSVVHFLEHFPSEITDGVSSYTARMVTTERIQQVNDQDNELSAINRVLDITVSHLSAGKSGDLLSAIRENLETVSVETRSEILAKALQFAASYSEKIRNTPNLKQIEQMNFELREAITENNISLVEKLVNSGAIINEPSHDGTRWLPLHFAASLSDGSSMVTKLIQLGADPTIPDLNGWLPLHLAASNGTMDTVVKLMFSPELRNSWFHATLDGTTALDLLARNQSDKILATINERTKDHVHQNLFQLCINENKLHLIPQLIALGIDVNENVPFESEWSAMHLAVNDQKLDAMSVLLANHASPNNADKNNWTPLHLAALKGNQDAMQLLLEHNGDILAKNKTEQTPLDLALLNEHIDLCKHIVEYYRANSADGGKGLVHILSDSSNSNEYQILENWLKHNLLDPNEQTKNEDGWRPIHFAVHNKSIAVFDILMLNGANINNHDNNGYTALHLAVSSKNEEMIRHIVNHHNPNLLMTNSDGLTAWELAQQEGMLTLKDLLSPNTSGLEVGGLEVGGLEVGATHNYELDRESGDDYELGRLPSTNYTGSTVDVNIYTLFNSMQKSWETLDKTIKGHPNINLNSPIITEGDDTWYLLHSAVGSEPKNEAIVILLKAGANPNQQSGPINGERWTPLLLAILSGVEESCSILLKYGADPNICDLNEGGWFPLHYLAEAECNETTLNITKKLLDAGANPSYKTKSAPYNNALQVAIANNNVEVSKLLYEKYKELDIVHNLITDLSEDELNVLSKFVSPSDDLENEITEYIKVKKSTHGRPPIEAENIYNAIETNDLPGLCQMLSNNSYTIDGDRPDSSPLYMAVSNNKEEMVDALLKAGANPNLLNNSEWSPLIAAINNGNIIMVEKLINSGANINQASSSGWTPLFYAVLYGKDKIIQMLQKHNAKNIQDYQGGWSPLHLAASKENTQVIWQLCSKMNGREIHCKDFSGDTPLHIAAKHSNIDAFNTLLKQQASPNTPNNHGWTPMHILASKKEFGSIVTATMMGANILQKNNSGETTLDIISQKGCTHTVCKMIAQLEDKTKYITKKIKGGNIEDLRYLLGKGFIDPNMLLSTSSSHKSLLAVAAENNNMDIVKLLMEHGADIKTVSESMPVIGKSNHIDMFRYLIKMGLTPSLEAEKSIPEPLMTRIKEDYIQKSWHGKQLAFLEAIEKEKFDEANRIISEMEIEHDGNKPYNIAIFTALAWGSSGDVTASSKLINGLDKFCKSSGKEVTFTWVTRRDEISASKNITSANKLSPDVTCNLIEFTADASSEGEWHDGWHEIWKNNSLGDNVQTALSEADLCICYPTYHYFTANDRQKLDEFDTEFTVITEYDCMETMIPLEKTTYKEYRLGIGSKSLGVFTSDLNDPAPLASIRNEPKDACLLGCLLNMNQSSLTAANPSDLKQSEATYKSSHHLFFAYMADYPDEDLSKTCIVNIEDWAIACIKKALLEDDNKDIDICLPLKPHHMDKIKSKLESEPSILTAEEKNKLKQIDFLQKNVDSEINLTDSHSVASDGKINVRLINGFRLHHESMMSMIGNADPFVGLTGDQSLYEGIQSNKLVTYQALRWKQQQFENLVDLCKTNGLNELAKFYELQVIVEGQDPSLNWRDLVELTVTEKITLQKQCDTLNKVISSDCNLNGVLEKITLRNLQCSRFEEEMKYQRSEPNAQLKPNPMLHLAAAAAAINTTPSRAQLQPPTSTPKKRHD